MELVTLRTMHALLDCTARPKVHTRRPSLGPLTPESLARVRTPRTLPAGALFAGLLFVGCAPATHLGDDAGRSGDAASSERCDPTVGPCRATLRCSDLSACEGLRLSDGEVRPDEPTWDFDVHAYIGRYLTLSGARPVGRFGEVGTGTATTSFPSLADIPGDPSMCTWEGLHLLCGVNTSGYEAVCAGDGLLVRDASERLYRLRVIEDGRDDAGWFLELEWSAIAP